MTMNLLLAEDSDTLGKLFRAQLRRVAIDHSIQVVATKREVLAALSQEKFELIFIDMALEEHCNQVIRTLSRELEKDSTKTQVSEMTSLGLVEITRKRTSESLERLLTEPCPACSGRGIQKTPETVCYEIFREILREVREFGAEEYLVIASQTVIDLLLEDESTGLADLQDFVKKTIKLQVEPSYEQEEFDVVLM